MLLIFTGKGCGNCPFLNYVLMAKVYRCKLDGRSIIEDIKLNLLPDLDKKPKDCPFAQYPNTLEICAHDKDEEA